MTDLMTPKQAAEALGVTQGTLMVWRSTKRYPLDYVKVGRLVRYRPEDIRQFLNLRKVAGAG